MASALLNRSFTKDYPRAVDADGVYVTLDNGQKILDGCCGAAVTCLGYRHPTVLAAMMRQMQELIYVHTSFYTHGSQEDLASFLIGKSHGVFSHVAHYSSGSEAIETAIKIARQYHISNNDPDRTIILSRTDSYHGNTLGALAAGGNRPRRKPFEPLCSPAFQHVDRCFYPQDALPFESEQDYLNRLLASYEARFQELGPNKIAALLLEPVGGATLGTVIPVANYLARVRQLCNEHGALLIYDEVMCGMGRCGTYHAWEGFGGVAVAPDLQTIGKGLAAGYQPLSSVLVAGKIYGVMAKDRKNAFTNGHTYQGHALGCAAALAVQHVIFEHSLLDNVRQQGERLRSGLSSRLDSAWVSDTRGCGLFQTVEFRASKGGPVASRVRDLCFERGLALYVVSGGPDAILFAPPFVITDTEVDSVIDIFVSCVRDICETRPSL